MKCNCIKIGIAGAHSTGKSTFLAELRARLNADSVSVKGVGDLATEARNHGLPILTQHTRESTLWIINRGIQLEEQGMQNAEVLLVDRPVPDALGYLFAALAWRKELLPAAQMKELKAIVRSHASTYDHLFVTEIDPDFPIDTTKERDTDPVFREMAEDGVRKAFYFSGRTPEVVFRSNAAEKISELMAKLRRSRKQEGN